MTSKEAIKKARERKGMPLNTECAIITDNELKVIEKDLEILDILRKHLYVAPELVELKMTGQEYANIHKVKYHNGIPIVADKKTFNKINDWFYSRGGRK